MKLKISQANRRLFGFLIAILLSLPALAQDNQPKVICLPDSIISKVIDELIVKDHLTYTVNQQDSIITIYKKDLGLQKEEIVQLKLNAKNYEQIIASLNEDLRLEKQTTKELRKQNTIGKIIAFAKGVLVTTVVVIIYVLIPK